jgi:hypothetical protein
MCIVIDRWQNAPSTAQCGTATKISRHTQASVSISLCAENRLGLWPWLSMTDVVDVRVDVRELERERWWRCTLDEVLRKCTTVPIVYMRNISRRNCNCDQHEGR